MTQEMIHELIFDFVNGKTKSFKFYDREEAVRHLERIAELMSIPAHTWIIGGELIFLDKLCSVRHNSYPKPKDEE